MVMSMNDKVCEFCVYSQNKKKCKEKKLNQKGECESFVFVFASPLPYSVINELSQLDSFYDDISNLVGMVFSAAIEKTFLYVKCSFLERTIEIINVFEGKQSYGVIHVPYFIFGDGSLQFSVDKNSLRMLKAIFEDTTRFVVEFTDIVDEEDTFYMGEGLVINDRLFRNPNVLFYYKKEKKVSPDYMTI